MKYENKDKVLGIIKSIQKQEKIIERVENAKKNLNHYSVYIGISDCSTNEYLSLNDSQAEDFLNRIIEDANNKIEEYKQEIQNL